MADVSARPLLSVCLPTYNAGPYLDVVLSALLPQASDLAPAVEVVVVDDASPNGSPSCVTNAVKEGRLRSVKNRTNVGMASNIASTICTHARGEFVWVLSQHNLLTPGALQLVVDTLIQNPQFDAFHVNFRCATYPDQWPTDASGGYAGPFSYLSNPKTLNHPLSSWEDALEPVTGSGTQTYSHIVRRSVLARTLHGKTLGREYTTALDTYTQAAATAMAMFGKPAFYIGQPCLTIFNGAQTWSSLDSRARVYLGGYPDLINLYRRLGWPDAKFAEAHKWGNRVAEKLMEQLLHDDVPGGRGLIGNYLRTYWRDDNVIGSVLSAHMNSEASTLWRTIAQFNRRARSIGGYLFQRSRPARWVRQLTNSSP